MPVWATIIIGLLGTQAATELVKAACAAARAKKGKKPKLEADIEALSDKVENISRHTEENFMSILRLTIMDESMPMSERIIAGTKYVENNGNGDVKHFFQELKERCDA